MDGITAEAIKEIERLTRAAAHVEFSRPDDFPADKIVQCNPDGSAEIIDVPFNRHAITIDTPDEFARFVDDHKTEDSRVFYDENGLTFIFSLDGKRDHRAHCPMGFTDEFKWLKNRSDQAMGQPNFVRLLRIDLRRCLPDSALLSIVRNLNFNTGAQGAGNLQHGKESLGRSITAEVRGETAIPEEVGLAVPLWTNFGFIAPVTCAIEIFPQQTPPVFKLLPFPGQLDAAIDLGLQAVAELFTGDDFPLSYRGNKKADRTDDETE